MWQSDHLQQVCYHTSWAAMKAMLNRDVMFTLELIAVHIHLYIQDSYVQSTCWKFLFAAAAANTDVQDRISLDSVARSC
jgi:hypothetical protein